MVHPYSSIDTTAAWKKLRFILSVGSDFHMTDSLSIAVHTNQIKKGVNMDTDPHIIINLQIRLQIILFTN